MMNNPDMDALSAKPSKDTVVPGSIPGHWFSHVVESRFLFPVIAIVVLAAIWGTALHLIDVGFSDAEHGASVSSRELADTYESQVLRALREIDQTLKIVKSANDVWGPLNVLPKLEAMDLLPPALLFVVSIADSNGDVVASTNPSQMPNVSRRTYFQSPRQRQGQGQPDTFFVGRPQPHAVTGEWSLTFSRRLGSVDGKFAGIVMVSVDAAYFVSSYEFSKLGQHGILGMLGDDGIFRVRRSGETVAADDRSDYAALLLHAGDEVQSKSTLQTNAWDGVRRYTSARQVYGFPVAVIVGLSADDQLAPARRNRRVYLWRAAAGSLLVILIIGAMARLSHQLASSRRHAVEEHIAHAARVEYVAYHDSLTTLPNRSLFSKLLGYGINQARRGKGQLAVLFLDLDHFKDINDTLGHEAGDDLLREVAARLKTCLRESDTVARLGGDEFVVMLPDLHVQEYAAAVARKILSAVARPFVLAGQEYRVTASVGISTYPQDGLDEQTLTKNADIAMYKAKEEGKNNFQFYSEKLNASTLERHDLESGLRDALERNQFRLCYQAKRDTGSGLITGMEALLRWEHPRLGAVAPSRFIPLAEQTGLILPIGKWVLRTACLQNVAWQNQGLAHLNIAVNLTARQFFDQNLLTDLTTILADTGMDPHLLELEISEGLLMRDVGETMRVFRGIKAIGVRIAIDDFGIGYSLLASLKHFPLDTVKIERSFIRDVTRVADDKALTQALIAMGRTLSLTVVAQGVETKEQADFLRQNECDEFQGYYFDKPLPANQMTELIRTQALTINIDNDLVA
jgi:diguanylate cyclase (GGDEF)-like protein